jgi:RNA-binding protein 26
MNASPSKTELEFKTRYEAEKFMSGIQQGALPGVGKVEIAWVQSHLPAVEKSNPKLTGEAAASVAGDPKASRLPVGNGNGVDSRQHDVDYGNAAEDMW